MICQFPTLQLGDWRLHPDQARTYYDWAARNLTVDGQCECVWLHEPGGCATDITAPYTNPIADGAPWVDPAHPESARFLGIYVYAVSGLDDGVGSRNIINRVGGGGLSGPLVYGPRGLQLKGCIVAADEQALAWGKRWWSRWWERPQDWTSGIGCNTSTISVHEHCSVGWVDLFDVTAPRGPEWGDMLCCGRVTEFTLDLSVGNPHLYDAQLTALITGQHLALTAGAVCSTCGTAVIGGGFESACDACPTCTVCPEPVDCLGLNVSTAARTVTLSPTDFDAKNRPNCGPSSGYYQSPYETEWADDNGRPTTSGHYLDVPQEAPEFDHYGAPSCATGSSIFGAYPYAPTSTQNVYVSQSLSTVWTARTVTQTLTPTQLATTQITLTPAAGAQVKNVRRTMVWRNRNATPQLRTGSSETTVLAGTSTTAVTTAPGPERPPAGWVVDLVLTWDEYVPAGTVTCTYTTAETFAARSLNGGSFPDFDPQGRPSVGVGSETYRDEVPITDPQGRWSCGASSAHYGDEIPTRDVLGRWSCGGGSAGYGYFVDWANRPSCGPDSGSHRAEPAFPAVNTGLGASVGIPMTGVGEITTPVAAGTVAQVNALTANVSWSNMNVWRAGVDVTYLDALGATITTALDCPNPTGALVPSGTHDLPNLPDTARHILTVTGVLRYSGPIGATADVHFDSAAVAADLGPNGGVAMACGPTVNLTGDRPCTLGPNGGTDRPCTRGPNNGLIGVADGQDRTCNSYTPGPNGGVDRALIDQCVTTSRFRYRAVLQGWSPTWAALKPAGSIDHPATTPSSLALLAGAEGATFPGLASPAGLYLFRLANLEYPCAGSQVLAARLCAKMTAPTAPNGSTWPGWTLAVTDRFEAGKILGGVLNGTGQPVKDADGYTRWPLDHTLLFDRNNTPYPTVLSGQLACPSGGTPGSIDDIYVEVQYIGGPSCRDCGPHAGTDRPCLPTVATIPTTSDAWSAPSEPLVRCWTTTPPSNADSVPIITLTSGPTELRSVEIVMHDNPEGYDCPSASNRAAQYWACQTPLATARIARVPANSTLTIDGRNQTITAVCTERVTPVHLDAVLASAAVLPADDYRKGAVLTNTSTGTVYLNYGADTSSTAFTVAIPPSGRWEMPAPVYTGAVHALFAADNGALVGSDIAEPPAIVTEASSLVRTREGRSWTWPTLTGTTCICVTSDSCATDDAATVTLEATARWTR